MSCMKLVPLVALLGIALYPIIAQGCNCFMSVPQDYYCSSPVVMKINVVSNAQIVIVDKTTGDMRHATPTEIDNSYQYQGEMMRRYRYYKKKVYKVEGDEPVARHIYSVYHSNLCGGGLGKGLYLVMGSTMTVDEETALTFTSCSYTPVWDTLDVRIKRRLQRKKYDETCDCSIDFCHEEGCMEDHTDIHSCPLYLYGMERFCYQKTVCKRSNNNGCVWKKASASC